MLRSQAPGLG